jgi:hypothetical protein
VGDDDQFVAKFIVDVKTVTVQLPLLHLGRFDFVELFQVFGQFGQCVHQI